MDITEQQPAGSGNRCGRVQRRWTSRRVVATDHSRLRVMMMMMLDMLVSIIGFYLQILLGYLYGTSDHR